MREDRLGARTPRRQGVKAIWRLPNPRGARRNARPRKSRDRRKPDAPVLNTRPHPCTAFLRNQANLKAILCGHLHFEWRGTFNGNVPMLVAGGNFEGHAYEISFT